MHRNTVETKARCKLCCNRHAVAENCHSVWGVISLSTPPPFPHSHLLKFLIQSGMCYLINAYKNSQGTTAPCYNTKSPKRHRTCPVSSRASACRLDSSSQQWETGLRAQGGREQVYELMEWGASLTGTRAFHCQ